MRNAYSNLLGEFVLAKEVEHADTHGFQVVCPCCRESVFKVQREASEFFSHRQAAKSVVSDCERRVAGLSPTAMAAINTASRGQTLKVFLSVIRDAIDLDDGQIGGARPDAVYAMDRGKLMASKRLALFDGFFFETHRGHTGHDWVADGIRMFSQHNELNGVRVGTSFNASIQARIAADVMRSMLTQQGKKNHSHLVRHALSRTVRSVWIHDGIQMEGTELWDRIVKALNGKSDEAARHALGAWDRELAPHGKFSYAAYARHRIESEMLGTLMRLPYKEMLADHRLGLHPLHTAKKMLAEMESEDLGMGYAPAM